MFTEFETDRLQLRPIGLNDLNHVFDYWTQELDIARYMTWKPHQTKGETQQFIITCIEGWKNNRYSWVIETKNTNEIIGSFTSSRIEHKLDIGYFLLKKHWGKGYMPEIIKSFTQEAFKLDGIYRIAAVCDVDNIASKRALEKSGMHYEGLLKSWLTHPNIASEPRDCHSLSIVKPLEGEILSKEIGSRTNN